MSYSSGLQREALFQSALVLFIFILIINVILNYVVKKGSAMNRRKLYGLILNILMYTAAAVILLILAGIIGYTVPRST